LNIEETTSSGIEQRLAKTSSVKAYQTKQGLERRRYKGNGDELIAVVLLEIARRKLAGRQCD